jgi:hypothetical protein
MISHIFPIFFPFFTSWDDPPSHQLPNSPLVSVAANFAAKLWAAPREVMQSPNIWMCRASAWGWDEKTPRH